MNPQNYREKKRVEEGGVESQDRVAETKDQLQHIKKYQVAHTCFPKDSCPNPKMSCLHTSVDNSLLMKELCAITQHFFMRKKEHFFRGKRSSRTQHGLLEGSRPLYKFFIEKIYKMEETNKVGDHQLPTKICTHTKMNPAVYIYDKIKI